MVSLIIHHHGWVSQTSYELCTQEMRSKDWGASLHVNQSYVESGLCGMAQGDTPVQEGTNQGSLSLLSPSPWRAWVMDLPLFLQAFSSSPLPGRALSQETWLL